MSERFSAWWRDRSERERLMLAIMGAAVFVFIFWLALWRPFHAAMDDAKAEHELAIARLERVKADAAVLKEDDAMPAEPAQTLVTRLAGEAGFTPTRLDPGAEGRVMLALPSAKPVALAKWIQLLEAQGVHVEQISLRPNSDATLSVDATLRARSK